MSGLKDYFFLLGLILVPSAVVTSVLVSSIQCAIARHTSSTAQRVVLAALALPLWAIGTVVVGVAMIGDPVHDVTGLVELTTFLPSSAILPLCIMLPWIAVTAYVVRTERPVWWKAGLIGGAVTIAGAVVWLLLGIVVGAETD